MKAVICGAGIAGLALAQRLDLQGWEVVVLEKAPGPRTQGYMVDFFGPGYDAAEAMGVLTRMKELGYHIEEASYLDEHGKRRAGLNYAQFGKALGGRLLSIMRPDLERALREHLSDRVDLRFAAEPVAVKQDQHGVRVTLQDGTTQDADLLVGADGVHSTIRRMVFGEEAQYIRHLGFHTTAYLFDDAEILHGMQERFCLTDTVDRQMGFYTLRDGRIAAFGVHRTQERTLPEDSRAAVRAAYRGLGWIVPRALDKCPPSPEVYYDYVAQVVMDGWSAGRTVLVGDAAHAVSLLAGQGASLGVSGAYVLAEELAGHRTVEQGIAAYEQRWRPVVEEKQQAGRNAAQWFLPASPLRLFARRMAMHLTVIPGVDKYLARSLSGKASALVAQGTAAQH
ncbi:FAD-dependent oxidoreductase [Streptomyces sp. NPDC006879]|uniref:FAD-dependent oxidoreductase n=1 Tax=Streptomyces sp. NPDC006879 TaxID=3364767 RepID=UPI0036CDB09A